MADAMSVSLMTLGGCSVSTLLTSGCSSHWLVGTRKACRHCTGSPSLIPRTVRVVLADQPMPKQMGQSGSIITREALERTRRLRSFGSDKASCASKLPAFATSRRQTKPYLRVLLSGLPMLLALLGNRTLFESLTKIETEYGAKAAVRYLGVPGRECRGIGETERACSGLSDFFDMGAGGVPAASRLLFESGQGSGCCVMFPCRHPALWPRSQRTRA